jgi:hypothetical protein
MVMARLSIDERDPVLMKIPLLLITERGETDFLL